jgi:hypothetical protein
VVVAEIKTFGAQRYTIITRQGVSVEKNLVWLSDNEPVDLTTTHLILTIFNVFYKKVDSPFSTQKIFSLTREDGLIGDNEGNVPIHISGSATATIPVGIYQYSLEGVANNKTTKALKGRFIVLPGGGV